MNHQGTEHRAKINPWKAIGILLVVGAAWIFFTQRVGRNSPVRAAAFTSTTAQPAKRADHTAAAIIVAPRESSPAPLLPTVGVGMQAATDNALSASESSDVVLPPPPSGDYDLNLTAEQLEAIVQQRYGSLLQTLKISQEQGVRLCELLKERQQVAVDAANTATLFGLDPIRDLPATRAAIEQFQSAVDNTLRTEFGDDFFTIYRDFDQTLRERNTVAQIARQAAAEGHEIGTDQQKQLVRILKTHPAPDQPADLSLVIFGDVNARASISDAARTQAASLLSAEQFKLLQQLPQN